MHKAEQAFVAGLKIAEPLHKRQPDNNKILLDLTGTYLNLGTLYKRINQPHKAQATHKKAFALLDTLAQSKSLSTRVRLTLGTGYALYGRAQQSSNRHKEALNLYGKAIVYLQPIVQQNANHPQARIYLRNAHWGRTASLMYFKRYDEAADDWKKAIQFDDRNTVALRVGYVLTLSKANHHKLAAKQADKLGNVRLPAPLLYELAKVYGQAIKSIADEKNAKQTIKEKWKTHCTKRALELLRQAVRSGFRDRQALMKSQVWAPIRSQPGFRQLLTELDQERR